MSPGTPIPGPGRVATGRESPSPEDPQDFSFVLGGPLFQLVRRAHLSGDHLERLRRRVVIISMLCWLPLLILSALGGRAWGQAVAVPFLKDIDTHIRLLVALPLLIVAELVVYQRMRPLVRQFLERGLIPDTSRARFDAALPAAMRLRNSVHVEVALFVLVYINVAFIWPHYGILEVGTWYAAGAEGGYRLSPVGWWLEYV